MPGSREEDFLRNTSILHFLPQNYLPLSPYPTDATYQIWLGPVVSEEKMLTHDGRQPIAIGHLSDSGDLINIYC